MDKEFGCELSPKDMTLLLHSMQKLRDDLRQLAEALNDAALEMEEEEAKKYNSIALDTINKIKRQIHRY